MAGQSYRVVAAACVARLSEGAGERYFYRGDLLVNVDGEEAERLLDIGLVQVEGQEPTEFDLAREGVTIKAVAEGPSVHPAKKTAPTK